MIETVSRLIRFGNLDVQPLAVGRKALKNEPESSIGKVFPTESRCEAEGGEAGGFGAGGQKKTAGRPVIFPNQESPAAGIG